MSIESLAQLIAAHGYVIIFVAILLDCAGLPLPGELVLLTLGGLASRGHLDPVLGLTVAVTAALMGDTISYCAGRIGGERILATLHLRNRFSPGSAAVVFGRFVVGARVALAPLAGANRMPLPRFLLFDALGAAIWASAFVVVGYATRINLSALQYHWKSLTTGVELAVGTAVIACLLTKLFRLRRMRTSLAVALIGIMSLGATRGSARDLDDVDVSPAREARMIVPSPSRDLGSALSEDRWTV